MKSSKYLAAASLRNPAGNVVAPNTTTVTSAINDFLSNSSYAYESLALGIQNHVFQHLLFCAYPFFLR